MAGSASPTQVRSGLKNLKELDLANTAVTDAGLQHLKDAPGLEILNLTETKISDAGLEVFQHMPNLKELRLDNLNIHDDGLKFLGGLTKLRWLSLCGQITDAGLEHLKGLTGLKSLLLNACDKITKQGAAKLKAALPKTEFVLPSEIEE